MNDLPGDIQSDLTALADGSLPADRRARVQAQIESSPELAGALEVQQRAVAMIRAADQRAPQELHERVHEMARARPRRRRRPAFTPRVAFGPALAGAAGTLVAAAVVVGLLVGGSGSSLTFAQASAPTLGPATMAAPSHQSGAPAWLNVSTEGIRFPSYWGSAWSASGARVDRISGQSVTTVFYDSAAGARVGYAIVGGHPPAAHGGRVVWRSGISYRLLSANGVPTVTWTRGGRACIIAGRGVDGATLVRLASWSETGAV
jgi:hypothetical protein